jgi:4-amino-4-deoxy-L-arabinose transferase-like glycosyltransferase
MNIIFIGLIVRILFCLIFINYENLLTIKNLDYLIKLGGQGYDDKRFYLQAVEIARGNQKLDFSIGFIYTSIIGLIFRYTAESYFLGSLMSILAWFLSAIVFKKNLELFKINLATLSLALFFYTLCPSSIIFSSLMLRESYQLLFINLLFFSFLKIVIEKDLKYLLLLTICLLSLSYLHKTFIIFSLIFTFILFLIILKKKIKKLLRLNYFTTLFGAFILSLILINHYNFHIDTLLYKSISNHVNNLTISRTSYQNDDLIILNIQDFFLYLFKSFYNYYFQPTISHIENYFDFLLFFENFFRIIFLLMSLINIIKIKIKNYKYLITIFIFYCLIEIIWALGTNNYGTAVRHHMPQMGLLLLTAFFLNINFKKK